MPARFAGLRICRHLCGHPRSPVRPPVRSPVRPPCAAGSGPGTRAPAPFAGFGICRHLYAHLRVSHFARCSCRGLLLHALRSRRNRYRLRAGYATLLPDTARTCVERQLALSTFAARASVVVEERLNETRSRQARTGASASHQQRRGGSTLATRCSVVVDGRKRFRRKPRVGASNARQFGALGGEDRGPGPWRAVIVCLHRLGGRS